MKFFEWVTEAFGWCRIVISPLLIGGLIGAFIYLSSKNTLGFLLGLSHTLAGLWIGIRWANRAWKSKVGTVGLLAGVSSGTEEADTNQPK
jgi:uncharacterized protein YqgC (DUF456 family)